MALPGTSGQRISDLCNGNHITQKELAEKIGVSASQLSRIVSGERHNSKKPAYRDSNGFPVRPDERTPGTPGGSKAGFTAFERPEDGGT